MAKIGTVQCIAAKHQHLHVHEHGHIMFLLLSPMIHNDNGHYIAECLSNMCNLMTVLCHKFNNSVIAIIITFIKCHISCTTDLIKCHTNMALLCNQTIGKSVWLRFIDKSFNVSIKFIDLESFFFIGFLNANWGKRKCEHKSNENSS